MPKKPPPLSPKKEDIHIEVEGWQWESKKVRLGWKQYLILSLFLAGGLLFAFGFLVISVIALGLSLVVGLILFIFRKLEII